MFNKGKTGLLALFLTSFLITGCSTATHLIYHPQPINIPAQVYSCVEPTPRPVGNKIMESQVAKYIASLEKAVPDCKYKLKEVQAIVACFNDKKCNPDSLVKGLAVADEAPNR